MGDGWVLTGLTVALYVEEGVRKKGLSHICYTVLVFDYSRSQIFDNAAANQSINYYLTIFLTLI